MGVLGTHQILILVYRPRSYPILRNRYVSHVSIPELEIGERAHYQGCFTTTNNILLGDGI